MTHKYRTLADLAIDVVQMHEMIAGMKEEIRRAEKELHAMIARMRRIAMAEARKSKRNA